MNKYQVELGEDGPVGAKRVNAFAMNPEDAAQGAADSWLSTGVCEEVPIAAVRVYVGEGKDAELQEEPVLGPFIAVPKNEQESSTQSSTD